MDIEKPETCPACRGRLFAHEIEGRPAHVCEACDGVWLSAESLEAIAVREGRRHGAALVALHAGAEEPEAGRGVTYRPCPLCGALMARKRFARGARLVVDVCHAHGIWLDPGELGRIRELARGGAAAERLTPGARSRDEAAVPSRPSAATRGRPRRGSSGPVHVLSEFVAQLALELFT